MYYTDDNYTDDTTLVKATVAGISGGIVLVIISIVVVVVIYKRHRKVRLSSYCSNYSVVLLCKVQYTVKAAGTGTDGTSPDGNGGTDFGVNMEGGTSQNSPTDDYSDKEGGTSHTDGENSPTDDYSDEKDGVFEESEGTTSTNLVS